MGRMRPARGARALLVGAALLAGPGIARPSDDLPATPRVRAPEIRTVSGTIRSVTPGENAFTVETEHGPLRLRFDLNTAVFLPERISTVRALEPGRRIRAAIDAGHHAYWIELQAPARAGDSHAAHAAGERAREGRPVLASPHRGERRSAERADAAAGPDTGDAPAEEAPGEPAPDPGAPVPPTRPGPGGDMPPVRAMGH